VIFHSPNFEPGEAEKTGDEKSFRRQITTECGSKSYDGFRTFMRFDRALSEAKDTNFKNLLVAVMNVKKTDWG